MTLLSTLDRLPLSDGVPANQEFYYDLFLDVHSKIVPECRCACLNRKSCPSLKSVDASYYVECGVWLTVKDVGFMKELLTVSQCSRWLK